MKYIDLSHPINEDMPLFPGDPQTKIENAGTIEKNGFEQNLVSICTHTGTHVDAPRHMIPGGKNLDQIPVSNLIGKGVYIKVNEHFDFVEIEKADIREGDIVLFHIGMSDKYHAADYFDSYPVMSEEIANYLVLKRVKMVGVDACSVDSDESFPIHKIFLKNNILIIENLTNLGELAGKKFKVYALPLKLEVDGAPVRVVAEVA